MYPESAELLLVGCLTELIWTPKFKSSMSTPNTSLQTYWQKGISHAMSGTIFFICLTSAISALSAALRIFSLTSCTETMVKKDARTGRRQQDRGKVKADDATVHSPIASKSLGILKAPCRTDWSSTGKPDSRDRNHDAASSSQGWQKDAVLDVNTGKLVATEEDQEHLIFFEDSVSPGKPVAAGYPGYPGILGNSGDLETKGSDEDWPRNLHISSNYVLHMEKVFLIVRQRCGRSPHSSSCSSSWERLHGNFAIYQESTQEIVETVISSDWEVDHGSNRKFLGSPRLTGSCPCGERRLC